MGIAAYVKSFTKGEWWFLVAIAIGVIAVTGLPYVYGCMTAPAGTVYTGLHHLTPGDTNVFLSMIEQTKQGENVFINLYTSEPQERLFVNPLWLSVGWIGRLLGASGLLALHIARSLLIAGFIFVAYLFIAYFIEKRSYRRWALLLLVFSSGLGVFFNPFLFDTSNIYEHPTDIWVAESITFLTLYHSPHLVASLMLIILVFLLMLFAFSTGKFRYSAGAGAACLLLVWFHPFNGPTVFAVLGIYIFAYSIVKRKIVWSFVRHYVVLGLFAALPVAYLYWLYRADWVIRSWSSQNILPSPSVWMYLIGFGAVLLFAIVGAWRVLKKQGSKQLFIVCWAATSAVLLYVPVDFQRRLSEGLHVPLALLAFLGISYAVGRLRETYGADTARVYILMMLLIVFLPLTNIQILGQDLYMYSTKKTLPYYLYEGEVEAMHWLRDNAAEREITFSSYYMGNFIPAYSGRIVWIGHGPQTIDLPRKKIASDWFWEADAEISEKRQFLYDEGISFVFYGRKEEEIGTFDPDTKPFLEQVFRNEDVSIYRVQ
ncbi:MAG: hypothetical protein WC505_04235 [Patescibacteria group bacterium]